MYKNKVTATYSMTNILTGEKHSYFIVRRAKITRDEIIKKFHNQLKYFPAYTAGIIKPTLDIFVTNYKNQFIEIIKP